MASAVANMIDPTGICARPLASPPILCVMLILNVAKIEYGDLTPYHNIDHTLTQSWFDQRLTYSRSSERWIDPHVQEAQGRSLGTPPPLLTAFPTTSPPKARRQIYRLHNLPQFAFPRQYWDPCDPMFNVTAEKMKQIDVTYQHWKVRDAQETYIHWLEQVRLFLSFDGCIDMPHDIPELPNVQPLFEIYFQSYVLDMLMAQMFNVTPTPFN